MSANRIGIIGAGQVGGTCAFLAAEKGLGDVVLVDIVEGLAAGKALDISHAAAMLGIDSRIRGTERYEDLAGCGLVIVTAGKARRPGMTRLDLLKENECIIRQAVESAVKFAPDCILIMVTNPLDVMTYVAYRVSGFEAKRVMGQAGVLDSARFRYYLSQEAGIAASRVDALMLGGHGDTMVAALSQTRVDGRPAEEILSHTHLVRAAERARDAGAEVVRLLKTGSAYYGPAAATVSMAEAVLNNRHELMPVSAYMRGEYGLKDIYIGVPARLGARGVEEVVEVDLDVGEKEELLRSALQYRDALRELGYVKE